jgi:hypothetical protein
MDKDAMPVVDGRLRVRGVAIICVADASMVSLVPSGKAPPNMIGDYCAEFIRRDHLVVVTGAGPVGFLAGINFSFRI